MRRGPHDDVLRALLVLLDLLVLVGAGVAVPGLRAERGRPPADPTAAQAVAHLEQTWSRASALPRPGALARRPGVGEDDDCGIGPRPVSGRGEALGDAYGYAWLLRTDGGRAVVTGSTPCLRSMRPTRP